VLQLFDFLDALVGNPCREMQMAAWDGACVRERLDGATLRHELRLHTSSYKRCEMKKRVPIRERARALSSVAVAEAIAVCPSPPLQPHFATVTPSEMFSFHGLLGQGLSLLSGMRAVCVFVC
jgi:hypothetical protein